MSFWAAVPHYVAQPPCPKATLALLRRVEDLLDTEVPLLIWSSAPAPGSARSTSWPPATRTSPNTCVRSSQREPETELPEASGDAIAREFERYLRRRDSR